MNVKTITALGAALTLGGCVFAVDSAPSTLSGDDPVSVNARRAVETCGEGKVAAVSAQGYACQGADQAVIDEVMGRGADRD